MKVLLAILLGTFLGVMPGGSACPAWASDATPLTPQAVARLKAVRDVNQLILVGGTGGSNALFTLYERDNGPWREVFTTRAYIGKNGLGKKREGDGKTPIGVFHFTKAFGIAPDPGCAVGYTQVDDTHYWVGDSASPHYNQFVSTRDGVTFNKADSEHIVEYTRQYQYCLNISYNEAGTPGLGSAIFLHCQAANPYTGGCVAIPEGDMRRLLRALRPGCVIAIAKLENLAGF